MPNPKRRHSKSRRGKRRAHDFLTPMTITHESRCPNCQEPKAPHRACSKCGYYRGRQVMKGEEDI
jgi:large subunit ribosomal protein L32